MARNTMYAVIGIFLIHKHSAAQICNLGKDHRSNTSISSEYVYRNLYGTPSLSAEKALDGKYHDHPYECAGSKVDEPIREAWWQVTFSSTSKIFKINLVFRELLFRHAGYYVFITNRTVTASELTSLDPVYHDEEPSPSLQNTIIFPEGHTSIQVFLYVNKSNPTATNYAVIEPCEVEIYGCVEEYGHGCTCSNTTAGENSSTTLWNSTVVFGNGSLSLTCDSNYLSLMNVLEFESSQFISMLTQCDGKQQCSFKTNSTTKGKSISFYCFDKCLNENYTNTILKYNLAEDLEEQYPSDVKDSFTAFLKSRVFECKERHVLTDGNLTLQCRENGRWLGKAPVCNVTCQEPDHEDNTTILQYGQSSMYLEDASVTYTCRKNHRHIDGNLIRVCNGSGDWTGEKPVCKRCKCPCDRVRSQYFISDPLVLKNRLDELKKELEVHKEKLSKTVRAKTCAKDERTSARGIGSVLGVGIIVFVLVIIVCSDLPLLYRQIRYGA